MKKLLISNIVTAVIVLGIIAAYSFSKPEQKSGAKYATVTADFYLGYYNIVTSVNGKSEAVTINKKYPGENKVLDWKTELDNEIHKQLEKLDSEGYQVIGTDAIFPNGAAGSDFNFGKRYFTLRKQ